MTTATKRDSVNKLEPADDAKKPDGRLLRSERSRQLIIDACQELVNEGVLVPTAQNVADRAGVGIRTVFRHFADMETLFSTMDTQLRQTYEGLFRSEEHTSELQSRSELVCRLLLEKKKETVRYSLPTLCRHRKQRSQRNAPLTSRVKLVYPRR